MTLAEAILVISKQQLLKLSILFLINLSYDYNFTYPIIMILLAIPPILVVLFNQPGT